MVLLPNFLRSLRSIARSLARLLPSFLPFFLRRSTVRPRSSPGAMGRFPGLLRFAVCPFLLVPAAYGTLHTHIRHRRRHRLLLRLAVCPLPCFYFVLVCPMHRQRASLPASQPARARRGPQATHHNQEPRSGPVAWLASPGDSHLPDGVCVCVRVPFFCPLPFVLWPPCFSLSLFFSLSLCLAHRVHHGLVAGLKFIECRGKARPPSVERLGSCGLPAWHHL